MFKNSKANESNAIDVASVIDFTLLDPRATKSDLEKMCDIAYKKKYYAVCVNPCNVSYVKGYILKNFNNALKVVAVVGFPLGANSVNIKAEETRQALADGADEIDVVINIGEAKQHSFEFVKAELSKIRKLAKKHIVKAILETCYFDQNEIIKLCKVCIKAKVDFIKTSTGFGTAGANKDVVKLILGEVSGRCKVKASGGIRTREQAIELINFGANRIGTSSII